MVLEALKTTKHVPIQKVNLARQNEENLQPEVKKPAEKMLFEKQTAFLTDAPKIAAISKPIAEHSQAAASTGTKNPIGQQLFSFNNDGRIVAATYNPSGTVSALSSALSGAESNKGSGNKKDEQGNTFVSAHKSLKDTRFEALDDNVMSIMKGFC